jgi:hypothetical protein
MIASQSGASVTSSVALSFLVFLVLACGCCGSAGANCPTLPADIPVVPIGEQRATVPSLNPGTADLAVCVVRSKNAGDCIEGGPSIPVCVAKSAAEVKGELAPFLDKLASVKLKGPSDTAPSPTSAVQRIQTLIPGALATTAVHDARREHACSDVAKDPKTGEGPCVAVRFDKLWVLLHTLPGGDGTITSYDLFPTYDHCDNEIAH